MNHTHSATVKNVCISALGNDEMFFFLITQFILKNSAVSLLVYFISLYLSTKNAFQSVRQMNADTQMLPRYSSQSEVNEMWAAQEYIHHQQTDT